MPASIDDLVPCVLRADRELRAIPFTQIVFATTGNRVLAIDPKSESDQRVLKGLRRAFDETVARLNAPGSPIQNVARINEASSHVEDLLRELLNAEPGLSCDFPRNNEGHIQRSGYPDLRIVDAASQRVFYLDPKLYAAGSRTSSFRTFYFEPKTTTNKIREDAVHLLAGFEHDLKNGGRWKFTRWDLVDLAQFKVRLKAEFQGSNTDLYRPETIVATSGK